jgi:hypothetical protein
MRVKPKKKKKCDFLANLFGGGTGDWTALAV